ncbi:MAG: hypothetical protein D5R97_07445 [Candidatus Syntrophonatronum acetioxidans]|uniref:Uncharacterized protein n=1 Tax=Candidatus Syntrophonatronum acetioxidans TaxID=1795816 RepID=A0A424YC17_9FIRM|nr:MAG: hypothetical protein D5R97_07445 [Candidatus Syntrophonatronum acetioxidans]
MDKTLVKKGIYLRSEQVEHLAGIVFENRKRGKRKLNESLLCRVALDLLFNLNFNYAQYETEEELSEAIINQIKN